MRRQAVLRHLLRAASHRPRSPSSRAGGAVYSPGRPARCPYSLVASADRPTDRLPFLYRHARLEFRRPPARQPDANRPAPDRLDARPPARPICNSLDADAFVHQALPSFSVAAARLVLSGCFWHAAVRESSSSRTLANSCTAFISLSDDP